MSKKQHEPLDKRDLHQNVSQPHRDEIKQRQRRVLWRSSLPRKRQNQKGQYRAHRNYENEQQNQNTEIYFPVNAMLQPILPKNLPGLQREEEKWSIVADRRHVVRVAARESIGIVAGDEIGKRILLRLRRQVQRIQLRIMIKVR